tara:strand:+ start:15 stop:632 length:618 start_codon:yes stop_codon:yes gene_type:complete
MRKTILAILAISAMQGLLAEELKTETLNVGRMGDFIMMAGYTKHFTDKYPLLLDREFRHDIYVEIYGDDVIQGSVDPFPKESPPKLRFSPNMERCVSKNRTEETQVLAARYINIFELHGVEFTSIEGSHMLYSGAFELEITNTSENIDKIRKLFEEFSGFYYEHRGDFPMYPIRMKYYLHNERPSLEDGITENTGANKSGDDNSE